MDKRNVNSTEKSKDNSKNNSQKSLKKQYHPALCNAMELEFYYDRDILEFEQNFKLNTLPREIDFLIIRKNNTREIKNELGKFFRKCNIWEFKGYSSSLDASVYHKTMSYAYEYLSIHEEIEDIENITLSFLREGFPKKLMAWLEKESYKKYEYNWIIRYHKEGCPDLQIVNIAHPDASVLLKVLSHKADPNDIMNAAEYLNKLPENERNKARLIMQLSYEINGDIRGGNEMGGFFEAYVDPLQDIINQKKSNLNRIK